MFLLQKRKDKCDMIDVLNSTMVIIIPHYISISCQHILDTLSLHNIICQLNLSENTGMFTETSQTYLKLKLNM